MAYTPKTFVPFTPVPASDLNDLAANDASFNDGTGIGNATITASKLATGAGTSNVTTSETTTSTSYVGLTTPQTVTVTVGANGLLLVGFGAQMSNSGANFSSASVALSGANTVAAADDWRILQSAATGASAVGVGRTWLFTGLTPGSTTVTLQFKVAATTGTFANRNVWALPL